MKNSPTDQVRNSVAIGDLANQIELSKIQPKVAEYFGIEYDWDDFCPYWEVVRQSTIDSTLSDWEPEFYPDTTTSSVSNRVPSRLATAGGELNAAHYNGSDTAGARLFKLVVHSVDYETVPYFISTVGAGTGVSPDIQLKVNGSVTSIASAGDAYGTLDLVPGYNVVVLMSDPGVDSFVFEALLFNGTHTRWQNPNKSRNPQRSGSSDSDTGGTGAIPEPIIMGSGSS